MGNPWKLTGRQAEVMDLIVSGGCNKSMARLLGVDVKTVESHFATARKAMAVRSRAHAAVLWDRWRTARLSSVGGTSRYAWTKRGMVRHPNGAWLMAHTSGPASCATCDGTGEVDELIGDWPDSEHRSKPCPDCALGVDASHDQPNGPQPPLEQKEGPA